MKSLKEIARFVLAMVIMLSTLALALSIFTRTTMLSPSFYMHRLDKASYFTYLDQEIQAGFKNYSLITSIPEIVFSSAVDSDEIRSLTEQNIENTMAYIKHERDYEDVKLDQSGIDSAVRKYAAELTGEESQLSTVTQEASDIVNSHAVLFDVSAVKKYSQFQSLRTAMYMLYSSIYAIGAFLFALGMVLFLSSRKTPGAFQLWLGGSLIASSLIILVPTVMGFLFNVPYRFAVENYYLKVGLSSIMVGYLDSLAVIGAIMLAAGAEILYLGMRRTAAK